MKLEQGFGTVTVPDREGSMCRFSRHLHVGDKASVLRAVEHGVEVNVAVEIELYPG